MIGLRKCNLRISAFIAFFAASVVGSGRFTHAESFDWRNINGMNYVTPVKSQIGGSCWDFSLIGALEAKYKLTRNDSNFDLILSDQQLLSETNPVDFGSSEGGGSAHSVILDYVKSHGIVSQNELPDTGDEYNGTPPDALHWPLQSGWENRVVKIASHTTSASFGSSITAWKNALKSTGPIPLGADANSWFYSPYVGPPTGPGGNHIMLITGFTDDASAPGGGCWIIKNSWGADWNGDGYGTIAYNTMPILYQNIAESILGAVYHTGPMYHVGAWDGTGTDYTGSAATKTWTGTSATWDTTSGTSTNWSGTFQWVNQEVQAVFGSSATNKAITINGPVIAHGLTISSSGYSLAANANSALTITSGGMTASNSVSFSTPIYIGGPQTWNIASGATLSVTGPLHTIVSDLTFAGAGTKTISGAIDGGGVLNTYGAKPGGIIQTGTGTLTITGTSNFAGNVTVNTGAGTLYIAPTGGGAISYTGAISGASTININSSSVTLGGGASNFTGSLVFQQACPLTFVPEAGLTGTFGCVINNNGSVTQNGGGRTVLSNTNTFTGSTTISAGILQANSGTGIPAASMLILNGGILQNYGTSAVTFTRTLSSTAGSNRFYWTGNGGGFAAGSAALNVNIGSGTSLSWGSTQGTNIMGTLKLSSAESAALTTFQNRVNLNGEYRTIRVADNPNSTADSAVMSGVISNSTGTGGIYKTGNGLLRLSGTNTYNGSTIITEGILQGNIGSNIPTNSYLLFEGGIFQPYSSTTFTRSLGTSGATVGWSSSSTGGGFAARSSALTVNINNNGSSLTWGSNIYGTLYLNASNSAAALTFSNGLNLNGGARTIQIDDNPNSTSDRVNLNGAITGGSGSSLTKNGMGTLYIQGSTANTYSGSTTIYGGTIYLNKTSGYAIPGDLILGGNTHYFVNLQGSGQISPTSKWTWASTADWQEVKLLGHSQTVTGLCDATGRGVVENTWSETAAPVTLTINNSTDCSFNGFLRDSASGSGTLNIVKTGTGTQTLSGDFIYYSGTTTISQGKLVLQNITDPSLLARNITNNSTLEISSTHGEVSSNYSGVISGSGSLNKTGPYSLMLSGSSSNTYTGATNISEGTVDLAKTNGAYAIPGTLNLSAPNGAIFVRLQADNQIAPTATINFNGGYWPHFELLGHALTVAGINDTTGLGVIENTQYETGINADATLTLNCAINSTFNGYLRNGNFGGSTGRLALVKNGAATLTLSGGDCGGYTGGLTVNAGTVDLTNGVLPDCSITINGGTLILPGGGIYGGAAASSMADQKYVDAMPLAASAIENNCKLILPENGTIKIDSIYGSGVTEIGDNAVLYVHSLVQDTLVIGGGSNSPAIAVPEPGTMMLLALGVLALVGVGIGRKNRG
jgi:autotransporter-associated beta strand protein